MRERDIEKYLVARAKIFGGEVRKVKWIGRAGAPDRFIMLPNRSFWVEVKAPDKKATPAQIREHRRMRLRGQIVHVVDSYVRVDEVLNGYACVNEVLNGF